MGSDWKYSKEWIIPSEYGNEKIVMEDVGTVIERLDPENGRKEDMLTALSEACLNAFEHGNRLNRELPVRLQMNVSRERVVFRVTDQGSGFPALPEPQTPEQKWAEADPRGWGLTFIRELSDRFAYCESGGSFTIEMEFNL